MANTAETERKRKRLQAREKVLAKNQPTRPLIYQALQRFTQASFRLIRWLRTHWHLATSLPQALRQLQQLYAKR